ncbi:hypothetical protein EHI_168830 [Entamoeba histolytica HM-1:IMSS]|uniref:Uncharacterized protein n=1 Tax=Entamoeba histolytica (strain ATCC 30459 / HM-1:IMSS / ABRM) TaxID=294381 RepID=B1N3F4_ENTH1|nr:hypothetical protein EHI_168830 [Entamoeba histolytica HM-1:IMSS]EDS89498.1 hypothetical protein EHI_168830 [Entamoeba histolytica HM-1:IMSS]|eukprot:XP_001913720.1 hypothetical protein EHI_168830 [Entamoeba histolytica HM-1:IMSS]
MSNGVLYSVLTNCKAETLTLEANLSFYYSRTSKSWSEKDGVPVIESSVYNRIYYVIKNVNPGRFRITKEGFEPEDFTIEPNKHILTEFLNKYDNTDKDTNGAFLSYGTVCFVKEKLCENDDGIQFNVKMQFIGFSQQSLDDIDDDRITIGFTTTNYLPKKFLKKKNLN